MATEAQITVEVLLFGPAAVAAGSASVSVTVPVSATAGEVIAAICEHCPDVAAIAGAGRLAVDNAFADADLVIRGDEELALIALVSGG